MTSENDTTKSSPDLIDIINNVHGFISLPEMELLYTLASKVPLDGAIVEIGSYQGRSTICLAKGAEVSSATVYAIDPHDSYEVDGTRYGMGDNLAYYQNITKYDVGDVVKTINLPSLSWFGVSSDLLFIDGRHDYESVEFEFRNFSQRVLPHGKIAMHDTAGFHPGVTRLVDEILAAGQWTRVQVVDAISVFERVK